MTNMTLSGSDYDLLTTGIVKLLNRRRRLAPWPFGVADTMRLFLTEREWDLVQELNSVHGALMPRRSVLNWGSPWNVPGLTSKDRQLQGYERLHMKRCILSIQASTSELFMATTPLEPRRAQLMADHPRAEEMIEWLHAAAHVEARTRYVMLAWNKSKMICTTYPQIHRVFPTLLQALDRTKIANQTYPSHYANLAIQKLGEVQAELVGTSPRSQLPGEPSDRKMLEGMQQGLGEILAEAVLVGPEPDGQQQPAFPNGGADAGAYSWLQ